MGAHCCSASPLFEATSARSRLRFDPKRWTSVAGETCASRATSASVRLAGPTRVTARIVAARMAASVVALGRGLIAADYRGVIYKWTFIYQLSTIAAMHMPSLAGRVAVVAGAARGAGRGIARMLGEAGAVVYCTGRSSRDAPNRSNHVHAGRPETIEDTAALVTAAGGTGIPVRVDHAKDDDVAALFERVAAERGRLDVLATVITGAPASWKPFLDEPPDASRRFVDAWI